MLVLVDGHKTFSTRNRERHNFISKSTFFLSCNCSFVGHQGEPILGFAAD
jgi:hypothetical protein